jgi:hypothetical protein
MRENIIMVWFLRNKKQILTVLFLIIVPFIVFGQTVEIKNPLGDKTITDIIKAIINWLYTIIIVGIAPIMYIIAGYRFITAVGDPEKINTAKRMALWTTIGLMVATAVYGIIALIGEILGVDIAF